MNTVNLMIGDLIKYNGEVYTVENVHLEYINFNSIILNSCENKKYIPITKIEPIPLTVEILQKNGFEKRKWENGWVTEELQARFICIQIGEYFDLWGGGDQDYVWITVQYVYELQHILRLLGLNDLANNLKI